MLLFIAVNCLVIVALSVWGWRDARKEASKELTKFRRELDLPLSAATQSWLEPRVVRLRRAETVSFQVGYLGTNTAALLLLEIERQPVYYWVSILLGGTVGVSLAVSLVSLRNHFPVAPVRRAVPTPRTLSEFLPPRRVATLRRVVGLSVLVVAVAVAMAGAAPGSRPAVVAVLLLGALLLGHLMLARAVLRRPVRARSPEDVGWHGLLLSLTIGQLARTVSFLAYAMTALLVVAWHQNSDGLPSALTVAAWLLGIGALVVLVASFGPEEDGPAPWRARLDAQRAVA